MERAVVRPELPNGRLVVRFACRLSLRMSAKKTRMAAGTAVVWYGHLVIGQSVLSFASSMLPPPSRKDRPSLPNERQVPPKRMGGGGLATLRRPAVCGHYSFPSPSSRAPLASETPLSCNIRVLGLTHSSHSSATSAGATASHQSPVNFFFYLSLKVTAFGTCGLDQLIRGSK